MFSEVWNTCSACDWEGISDGWEVLQDEDVPRQSEFARVLHSPSNTDAFNPVRTEKMARLEAVLLVAAEALSLRKLVSYATLADSTEAEQLIETLNQCYNAGDSAFFIEQVGNGYQLMTRPQFAPWLSKVHQRKARLSLSPAAMETLTIIAYRQPVTRADVESLRGVQSAEMLKHLLERGLIRIAGTEDSLGRPYLYGTTSLFLENFGLRSLAELPNADELRMQD